MAQSDKTRGRAEGIEHEEQGKESERQQAEGSKLQTTGYGTTDNQEAEGKAAG